MFTIKILKTEYTKSMFTIYKLNIDILRNVCLQFSIGREEKKYFFI